MCSVLGYFIRGFNCVCFGDLFFWCVCMFLLLLYVMYIIIVCDKCCCEKRLLVLCRLVILAPRFSCSLALQSTNACLPASARKGCAFLCSVT